MIKCVCMNCGEDMAQYGWCLSCALNTMFDKYDRTLQFRKLFGWGLKRNVQK